MAGNITAADCANTARRLYVEISERHAAARRGSVREFSTLDMDFDELMGDVAKLANAVAFLADFVEARLTGPVTLTEENVERIAAQIAARLANPRGSSGND